MGLSGGGGEGIYAAESASGPRAGSTRLGRGERKGQVMPPGQTREEGEREEGGERRGRGKTKQSARAFERCSSVFSKAWAESDKSPRGGGGGGGGCQTLPAR